MVQHATVFYIDQSLISIILCMKMRRQMVIKLQADFYSFKLAYYRHFRFRMYSKQKP